MRQFLRFIFEFPYEKIGNGFLWVLTVLGLLVTWPIGVAMIAALMSVFSVVNVGRYGYRRLEAYAYNYEAPDWQGFLAT